MAIFTSHVSGSSGHTSLTGSLRIMSPNGEPQSMILTASHASFGPAIGIGTSVAPNTTFAINDDLGLTDNATNSRFSIANTNAYVNVGTDTNNRGFMLWENGSSRLRFGTKESGVNFFNTLHLKSGQVGIGDDAATGVDLHVQGASKTALIGANASPPASDSKLYLGNTDTYIGHTTFGGGHMILQSTASIILINDRSIGASETQIAMLTSRNDVQDIRIEAPAGMNIDNNLNISGSVFLKNDGTANTRLHISGSGTHGVSIAPQGANNIQIDRDNTNARLALRRVDPAIMASDELGRIKIVGSEDGGETELGGSIIKTTTVQSFSELSGLAGTDLHFLNTLKDTVDPVSAFAISGSLANRAVFSGDIETKTGNLLGYAGQNLHLSSSGDVGVEGNLQITGHTILNNELATTITLDENQRVGIGPDPGGVFPAYMLDVNGDIRIRGNDIRDSSGDTAISFDGDRNTTLAGALFVPTTKGISGSADVRIGYNTTDGSGALRVMKGSAMETQLLVDPTGNVGIGILNNTPASKLHVKGTVTVEDDASSDVIAEISSSGDDGLLKLYENNVVTTQLSAGLANSSFVAYNFGVKGGALTLGEGSSGIDARVIFDGDSFDYYVGYDSTDNHLHIGVGDVVGTTSAIEITDDQDVIFGNTATRDRLQKFHTDPFRLNIFVNNSSGQLTDGTGTETYRRYLFSNMQAPSDKNLSYWRFINGFEVRDQSTTPNGSTLSSKKWQPPSTSERFEQFNSMAWVAPYDCVVTHMTITGLGEHWLRPKGTTTTLNDSDVFISIARTAPTATYATSGTDAGLTYISDTRYNSGGNKTMDLNIGTDTQSMLPGTSVQIDISSVMDMATTITAGTKLYMGLRVNWDSSSGNIFYEYGQTGDASQTNGYVTSGYLGMQVVLHGYVV